MLCGVWSEEGSSCTVIFQLRPAFTLGFCIEHPLSLFILNVRIFVAFINSQLLESGECEKKKAPSKLPTVKFQLLGYGGVPEMHSRVQNTEDALKKVQKLVQ